MPAPHRTRIVACVLAVAAVGCQDHEQLTEAPVEATPRLDMHSPVSEPLVYVSNGNSNVISVISQASHTVVAEIGPEGLAPARLSALQLSGVAISPDGAFLYAAGYGWVNVIATANNTVVDCIYAPGFDCDLETVLIDGILTTQPRFQGLSAFLPNPRDIAISPDGAFAYLTQAEGVAVMRAISTATTEVVGTVAFPPAPGGGLCDLSQLAVTQDWVYVTAFFCNALFVVDRATNDVTTITLDQASDVAVTPDGAFVYVAQFSPADQIAVIETATNTVVATIPQSGNRSVAITPDGLFVYALQVPTFLSNSVAVIERCTHTVVARIPVAVFPQRVAITPDGAFAYVTHGGGAAIDEVLVIETALVGTGTNPVVATVPVRDGPQYMAFTPAPGPDPSGGPCPVENQPPVANAGGPYSGTEGMLVTFDGSKSTDPDGDDLTFEWSFGDGGTATATARPSHTYADNDIYTVMLTVTDPDGQASTVATDATIVNEPPAVDAGSDAAIFQGDKFSLSAKFGDAGVKDAPWSFNIDWGDGTSQLGQTSDQSAPIAASHPYFVADEYIVVITVTDKDGDQKSDALTVTVKPLPPAEDAITSRITQLGEKIKENPGSELTRNVLKPVKKHYEAALADLSKGDDVAASTELASALKLLEGATGELGTPFVLSATEDDARPIPVLGIADAAAAGGDPGKLSLAKVQLNKGDQDRDAGKFHDAGDKYKDATELAREALAKKAPDQP